MNTVLIDGKIVMEEGKLKTVDEYKIYEKAQDSGENLLKRTDLKLQTKWRIV